ncbi:GDSL-type esterase/lipase family protein [Corynebacterium kroppenstedtii]|uniref:GDSL-type esterase/lipase family protein n=1 Tax=Corynebacterium sp. PCR 32 TaxID=3351342 RepID=UPI00309AE482
MAGRKSIAAAVGAVALAGSVAFGIQNGPQTHAHAEGSDNYVAFGDSIQMDPNDVQLAAAKSPMLEKALNLPAPAPGRCVSSPNPYPKRVGARTGLEVQNYGCAAATVEFPHAIGGDIARQVDTALREGTLNPSTRLVSLAFGFNDWYQDPNIGRSVEDRKVTAGRVMNDQIARVKHAAPNAKILLIGNPDLTDGRNNICMSNGFGVQLKFYYPLLAFIQDNIRQWQADVAAQNHVEFLDMMSMINTPNNNNGCVSNPDRLSAAFYDDAPHHLWGHLTDKGHDFYADQVASRLT